MNDDILTQVQVADYLQLSTGSLERYRRDGTGPACIKEHKQLARYRLADVNAWLDTREVLPVRLPNPHGVTLGWKYRPVPSQMKTGQ